MLSIHLHTVVGGNLKMSPHLMHGMLMSRLTTGTSKCLISRARAKVFDPLALCSAQRDAFSYNSDRESLVPLMSVVDDD